MNLMKLPEVGKSPDFRREECNVSSFYGEETIIVWKEAAVSDTDAFLTTAIELKKRNLEWSDALCLDVARMAVCHESPALTEDDGKPVAAGVVYEKMAREPEYRGLFYYLSVSFKQAFPEYYLTGEDLKKILLPPVQPVSASDI
jgi:hypothetical protein